MNEETNVNQIPQEHQKLINSILNGKAPNDLKRIPEGSYQTIDSLTFGSNFITCPAVILEFENGPQKCLHITLNELSEVAKNGKFKSKIDSNTFLQDLRQSNKIKLLMSDLRSNNTTREADILQGEKMVKSLLTRAGKQLTPVHIQRIHSTQFQLVMDSNKNASIWLRTKFLGLVS